MRSLHSNNERVEIPLHSIPAVGFESRVFAAVDAEGASVRHLLQVGHRLPEEIEGVDEKHGAVGVFGRFDGAVDGRDLGHVVKSRVEQLEHRRIPVREAGIVRHRLQSFHFGVLGKKFAQVPIARHLIMEREGEGMKETRVSLRLSDFNLVILKICEIKSLLVALILKTEVKLNILLISFFLLPPLLSYRSHYPSKKKLKKTIACLFFFLDQYLEYITALSRCAGPFHHNGTCRRALSVAI